VDTQPVEAYNSFPVIFGHSFLATFNALFNYRNGLMKLSFENDIGDEYFQHLQTTWR